MPGWIRRWQIRSVTEPVLTDAQRPEQTLVSKWFVPASEPVRTAPRLNDYPAVFFDPNPIPDQVYDAAEMGWWQPAPAHVDMAPRAADFPFLAFHPLPLGTVTVDNWFRPTEQPPKGLPRAADFPPYVVDTTPPVPFDPSLLQWYRPLQNPLFARPPAAPERTPYLSFDFEPVPVTVTPTPTPSTPIQPGAGGGGGKSSHWWPGIGAQDIEERDRIANQLRALYEGVYEAVEGSDTDAAEAIADGAASVVAEYAPTNADDLPQPGQVDWQAFIDDGRTAVLRATTRLRELTERVEKIGLRRAEDEDDEEAAMLLLM